MASKCQMNHEKPINRKRKSFLLETNCLRSRKKELGNWDLR